MFLLKRIAQLLILVGLLMAAYIFLPRYFPQLEILGQQEPKLMDTPLVVERAKEIAQLFTASFYTELVVDTTRRKPIVRRDTGGPLYALTHQTYMDTVETRLVLIAKGHCYAGITLDSLVVETNRDTRSCRLHIPRARIFSTVVNPSDVTIFYEGKHWSPEDVQGVKVATVERVRQEAVESGVLEVANRRAATLLIGLLKDSGYEEVEIEMGDR
ncbi:MAG: hypothetical protein CSA97_03365 [Bacteroidetes bacterium]|nr:MAG: hypothetical protein CSA97_03365 [Bacteroidota bacterium]